MLWFYVLRLPPHLREVNFVTNIPNKKLRALRRVWRMFMCKGRRIPAANHRSPESTSGSGHRSRRTSSEIDLAVVQTRSTASREESTGKHDAEYREAATKEAGPDAEAGDTLTFRGILKSLSDMSLLTLFLGKRQQEAEWVTTTTEGSKFHQRYGLLFEEYRGPAIGRRDATLDVDPATGRVDRGKLVVLSERPLWTVPVPKFENNRLRLGSSRVYRYHLQLMSKLLDMITIILVGCIVAGVGNTDDNISSIVTLIALSLILLLLLRTANPFMSRFNMLVLLLSHTADLIVYTCALFLIVGPDTDEDTNQVIGLVMLLSEALVLLVQMLEYATLGLGLAFEKYDEWKSKKQHKFFDVVQKLMIQNEYYLERKYADRWMVRTLSRGLHGRVPDRHELHWREAAKIYRLHGWSCLRWFLQECVNIWNDGIERYRRSTGGEQLKGQGQTTPPGRKDASLSLD